MKISPLARWLALAAALAAPGAALAGRDAITLYPGFGDSRGVVVEGRVIEQRHGHRSRRARWKAAQSPAQRGSVQER